MTVHGEGRSDRRVALVTGGNQGIGVATAVALARTRVAVVVTYLPLERAPDAGTPDTYGRQRAAPADRVIEQITAAGGEAAAVEADLRDGDSPALVFDFAETRFGGMDVLVHNASGWVADTFKTTTTDRPGRQVQRVTAGTIHQSFAVDAHAGGGCDEAGAT